MSTVGIFAGRGDVVLAMVLAALIGIWIGWKLRGLTEWIRQRRSKQP